MLVVNAGYQTEPMPSFVPSAKHSLGWPGWPFFPQTAWEWSEWLSEADCVTKLHAEQRMQTAAEN
jgi:hypothetical protein